MRWAMVALAVVIVMGTVPAQVHSETDPLEILQDYDASPATLWHAILQYEAGNYSEAYDLFRSLAEEGHAIAQRYVGKLHALGEAVRQDYVEAARWYRMAANQGDHRAQVALGAAYEEGQGVQRDYQEALHWYRKAAEQGHALAQVSLGLMYEAGKGLPQNHQEAVQWYRRAAEQGDAFGQFSLAVMYSIGRGVPQDYREAAHWFHRAAEQNYATAQFNLGVLYAKGQGVPQDFIRAHMWQNLAAAQGEEDAREYRDQVAKLMTPSHVAEAQRLAREWKPKRELGGAQASVVAAECAWVLWHQFSNASTGYSAWEAENAFPGQAGCAAMRKEEFRLRLIVLESTEGVTNVKRDEMNASYMYDKEGQQRIGRYACFPDTIDPREKN